MDTTYAVKSIRGAQGGGMEVNASPHQRCCKVLRMSFIQIKCLLILFVGRMLLECCLRCLSEHNMLVVRILICNIHNYFILYCDMT